MYYRFKSDTGGEPNVYMQALNNETARVHDGRFIENLPKGRISELPFRFQMKVRRNEDDDSRQTPRLCAYYYANELMLKGLVEALRSAGVDNLQTFPAVITEDGEPTHIEDYVVVNVTTLISCAVVDTSAPDDFPYIIDPAKAKGHLMFRLAESKMDLIVHEKVANELKKHNFRFLELTPLKEI